MIENQMCLLYETVITLTKYIYKAMKSLKKSDKYYVLQYHKI